MKFYDMCVQLEHYEDIDKIIRFSRELGWNGLGLVVPFAEFPKVREKLKNNKAVDIVLGAEIKVKNPNELRKRVLRIRKKTELIVVYGGDLEINRKALETPEVDILVHPWGSTRFELRNDSGLNHISARLAHKNNVSIGIDFRDLLYSYKRDRTKIFKNMLIASKLIRKYRSPFVLSSGALSPFDLRGRDSLKTFGNLLGFAGNQVNHALSDKIINENRKRLSKKWIMPGVEIE
jgi:ribonuclease P/MRP protein subunit RPP1